MTIICHLITLLKNIKTMTIHKRQPDVEHGNICKPVLDVIAIMIGLTIGILLGAITINHMINKGMDDEEKRFKKESILHQIRNEDDSTKRDSLWNEYCKIF